MSVAAEAVFPARRCHELPGATRSGCKRECKRRREVMRAQRGERGVIERLSRGRGSRKTGRAESVEGANRENR